MCGIAGFLNFNSGSRAVDLKSISRQLRNRGPDCEGYYIESEAFTNNFFSGDCSSSTVKETYPALPRKKCPINFAFVHRRLSIIDVSDASHQPMISDCKRYIICFNGEIYNYKELRLMLENEGVSFSTSGDTEVLLKLYVRFKEKCLELLNGDFAFSVWDKLNKELFLARDRVGIKPVFYTKNDNFFFFASDIKTIIASGTYEPEVNMNGLYLSFFFGIAPRPETAFKDVWALEPGTWLKIDKKGEVEKNRYWDIPHGKPLTKKTYSEAVEELKEKLSEAVNIRMRADVEVGSFMSGGVDSTTVTAYAAKKNPAIKAFTLGHPEDADFDEVKQSEAAAKFFGITQIVERVSPEYYLQNINKITLGYEEPFYSVSPNYIISNIVKNNSIKVVLNGLGGDELFAGYKYYEGYKSWRFLRHLSGIGVLFHPFLSNKMRRKFDILKAKTPSQYHTAFFSKHREEDVRELFGSSCENHNSLMVEIDRRYVVGNRFRDGFDALMYMDLKNYIGNHHVERTDQFTMMNSVEGRFPLLDHNLIEFAAKLPAEFKLSGKNSKRILKDAAKDLVPSDCLNMKKKGFSFPLEKWMRKDFKNLVEDHLASLKARGVFSQLVIDAWYTEFLNYQRPYVDVWHLVTTEMWFRSFIDKGFLKDIE